MSVLPVPVPWLWNHPALSLTVGLKLASSHSPGFFTFFVHSAGMFQTRKHQAWEDSGIETLRSLSSSILSRKKKLLQSILTSLFTKGTHKLQGAAFEVERIAFSGVQPFQ